MKNQNKRKWFLIALCSAVKITVSRRVERRAVQGQTGARARDLRLRLVRQVNFIYCDVQDMEAGEVGRGRDRGR